MLNFNVRHFARITQALLVAAIFSVDAHAAILNGDGGKDALRAPSTVVEGTVIGPEVSIKIKNDSGCYDVRIQKNSNGPQKDLLGALGYTDSSGCYWNCTGQEISDACGFASVNNNLSYGCGEVASYSYFPGTYPMENSDGLLCRGTSEVYCTSEISTKNAWDKMVDSYGANNDKSLWWSQFISKMNSFYETSGQKPSPSGDGVSVDASVCSENDVGGIDNKTCAQASMNSTAKPVALATGDKLVDEDDFDMGALRVNRHYHSRSEYSGTMGYGWNWTFGWKLEGPTYGVVKIQRDDGKPMRFRFVQGGYYYPSHYQREFEGRNEKVSPNGGGWRYTSPRLTADFDSSGRLTSLARQGELPTTLQYDGNGMLVSITEPFGRQLTVGTDASGRVTSITGPSGRVWQYAYDAADNLVSVTYPDGATRQYLYQDSNDVHNLTSIIDEAGRTYKQITYDAQDRAILSELPLIGYRDAITYNADASVDVTDSAGVVRHYTTSKINGISSVVSSTGGCGCGAVTTLNLDAVTGLLSEEVDKNGVRTTYAYDNKGQMITKVEAAGTADQRTTRYSYDSAGRVSSITDALNRSTTRSYDAAGHLTYFRNALGRASYYYWNANGTLSRKFDANSKYTQYSYDAFGQMTLITQPDGTTRGFAYDQVGRIVAVTDELGATTSYTYDSRDRVTSVHYPDGSSITNTFDVTGNLVSRTDTAGLVTTYTYDVEHRPLTMTRPDGSVVNSTFDAKGNLTARSVLDAAGVPALSESMTYDADGRLLTTTHADGTSVTNSYDMTGHLLSVTDEAGKLTSNSYDELGRLVSTTNQAGETVTYTYDAMDRPLTVTAANGATTSYSYDAAGHVLSESSPDRGTTTYVYGMVGELISKTDSNGVVAYYTYDMMQRLTNISYPDDPSRNVIYYYDPAGRLFQMMDISGATMYGYDLMDRLFYKSWMPANGTIMLDTYYLYDQAGRLDLIIYPSQFGISYDYGTDGRIAAVNFGLPLVSGISYNALGEVTSLTLLNGIVENRSYDNRGRLTALTAGNVLDRAFTWSSDSKITSITDNLNASASQSFGYDQSDRLTSASGGYGNINYTYDANGNRTSRTDASGTVNSTYESGSNRLASSGTTAFTRDAAGNRLTDNQFSYTYGVNNRLIAAADSAGNPVAGYVHNGKGERVSKTVNGVTTFYVYDPNGNLIGEYDETGTAIREYAYGPSGRIAMFDTATNDGYWYLNDHLGTPQALTDIYAQVVWSMTQTPFGIASVNEDPDGDGITVTNNIRFPGQYFDAETGLNHNGFRTYDPGTGYTQSDPIGLNGGMNTYAYVGGNPITRVDPLGLWSEAAHNLFIQVFGNANSLTSQQIQMMERGSAYADSILVVGTPMGHQSSQFSYMHAMTSEANPNKKAACELANKFIDERLSKYNNSRTNIMAYFNLGVAMHTVMDSTSPAHRDFQYWELSKMLEHGSLGEGLSYIDDNPSIIPETVELMNSVLNGKKLDCSCY